MTRAAPLEAAPQLLISVRPSASRVPILPVFQNDSARRGRVVHRALKRRVPSEDEWPRAASIAETSTESTIISRQIGGAAFHAKLRASPGGGCPFIWSPPLGSLRRRIHVEAFARAFPSDSQKTDAARPGAACFSPSRRRG